MKKPFYINKKGNKIELKISYHAIERLCQRWNVLFDIPLPDNVEEFITERFFHSNRVKNLSKIEKARIKKYGKDTLYFRHTDFTFVIQNAVIVTIEISNKNQRHLNKET